MENLMVKNRYYTLLFAKESGFAQKVYALLPYFIIGLVVLTTLIMQNRKIGFEKDHHGWVSSHTLAIMSKANSDNYFVGYTLKFRDEQDKVEYFYFDRYPVFFSTFFNVLLSLWDNDLPTKVYAAR